MYFGETAINLDAKGRLAIPTRYRDAIEEDCSGQLVLTYSAFDHGALWLYPKHQWEKVRDEVMQLSTFKTAHRSLQRRLVGSATAVEPDGTGRILLPQTLRQATGMEKHVVLMGMGTRFEIWDADTLNQQRASEDALFEEPASEAMANLVL